MKIQTITGPEFELNQGALDGLKMLLRENAGDDRINIEWAREAWTDIQPFSTGGTYVNFLTEDDGEDRIRDAYGDSYDRLVDIKTSWDPDNLFNNNKNFIWSFFGSISGALKILPNSKYNSTRRVFG